MENTEIKEIRKPLIPENVSKRITALRFLLIVFVVLAHNNKTYLFIQNTQEFSLFSWNTFFHLPQLMNYIFFAQAAVPMFFLFSAYLLAKKNDPYKVMIQKKAKALLTPYILWPALTILFFIGIKLAAIVIFPDKVNHTLPYINDWTLEDWICAFVGKFPKHYNNSLFEPYVGPFYYIRDLLIFSGISPLIRFCIKKCKLPYFMLLLFLYTNAPSILFGWQGLFYFSAGYLFGAEDIDFFEISDKAEWKYLIPLCVFATGLTLHMTGTTSNILVFFSCIVIMKFSKTIAEKWFEPAKYLAGFSFFLYAIHEPKFLNLIVDLWYKIIPAKNYLTDILEFFIVGLGSCAVSVLIGIALKKICPKLFYLLNGGR